MKLGRLFVAACACSGAAALLYEVTWTRLLTLYLGQTTAAATTVVAAFMGGLAGGSVLGGQLASKFTERQSLLTYAVVEVAVGVLALSVPGELRNSVPLLAHAYANGASTLLFPVVRSLICFGILLPPAIALGATFPFAIRAYMQPPDHPGRTAGAVYAANTAGAAAGALAAGFVLIPALGVFRTTLVGIATGASAGAVMLWLARRDEAHSGTAEPAPAPGRPRRNRPVRAGSAPSGPGPAQDRWLAAVILGCTGFATFMYEIAWTRLFVLVIGPSTYAFAATITAIILASAIGSAVGSLIVGRVRSVTAALGFVLAGAVGAIGWATWVAADLPRTLIGSDQTSVAVVRNAMRGVAEIAPVALALGIAFPLALEIAGRREPMVSRRLGRVYAINTIAAVAGTLVAGYVVMPMAGVRTTLQWSAAALIAAGLTTIVFGNLSTRVRIAGMVSTLVAAAFVVATRSWDRGLLASGIYKYGRYAAEAADPESALTAGTLLFYRDGAAATVSVKRLAGVVSLSIDGKVDASTSGDMLTQKLLAHVPLLLHGHPRDICIIGLGSGVTLASALAYPIRSADVVELSPEVVEASRFFAAANRAALSDPRTRLIVADGRSHLLLATRQYDVIVSEPSNPWMAGVAALFTREFFAALRNRLAPGGIVCQWAHTYDISDADLRSIVATFTSVFPGATMWLVGEGDVLLVSSTDPTGPHLANIEQNIRQPHVSADLAAVGATGPFAVYSLFAGGPNELHRYGQGATIQTDDRMALEFSGPRAMYGHTTSVENLQTLRALLARGDRPAPIAGALDAAAGSDWRDRGAMMLKADAYAAAYQDYIAAVSLTVSDGAALAGLVRTAVASHRQTEATSLLRSLADQYPREPAIRVALSQILAAQGRFDDAVAAAERATNANPTNLPAWEQLASVFTDAGDVNRLEPVVQVLERIGPDRASTAYYAAAAAYLRGQSEAALEFAQQAIARSAAYAAAENLIGAIHASRGEAEPARQAFNAALRLDAQDSATYANLGLLALSSHDAQEAFDRFAEALSLDPQSSVASKGLLQARALLSR